MNLLPDKKDSVLLEKAWSLDQEALLREKSKPNKKILWRKSIKICEELLKKNRDDINLLFKIATIYQHQRLFNEARFFLYRAKKKHPDNFLVYQGLGNLYRAKNDRRLSLKYYEEALKKSGNNKLLKKLLDDYKEQSRFRY